MTRRVLGAFIAAVITAGLVVFTQSTTVRADGCGPSGSGTDRLCAGGHLIANQYLVSSNGRYRFYYQGDGNTLIYDTIDWNNWDPSVPLFEPHENAGYLMFAVNSSGARTTEVNLWSFTPWHTSALPYYIYWGDTDGASHYLKLDDDGCLRAYQSDGSHLMNVWC